MSEGPLPDQPSGTKTSRLRQAAQVLIVSSVMFSFISYWRTAAVVLCDLASTAYYIGGIVEQSIGAAAPWFILAVMLFSWAVRSVYIESCTLFIRGGVYRVVREALGRFAAKFAISALLFDYVLTGPVSGVVAGQYIVGLILESIKLIPGMQQGLPVESAGVIKQGGSMLIAIGVTLYFFWQNLLGIPASSAKALRIVVVTTVMGVLVLGWCGLTLAVQGSVNRVPTKPDLSVKVQHEEVSGTVRQDPLGFLGRLLPEGIQRPLREQSGWLGLFALFGLLLAFAHSILAMSGLETLAQVYREVEAPKLANFKKAALVVFLYSIALTGGISFLAVLLIPNDVRMSEYADNLISGLAMHVWCPLPGFWPLLIHLLLHAFVVVVGFLILAGAVNTSIIGSNGLLSRVVEDGVLPEGLLKPHRRFGTSYRLLYIILGLQVLTILSTRGNVLELGQAYAFGVLWSFIFQAWSMVVLRYRDPRPRDYRVPFNFHWRGKEVPAGLFIILTILLLCALVNLLTQEVSTVAGIGFTSAFFLVFLVSERYHQRKGPRQDRLDQFNRQETQDVSAVGLGLKNTYRKLVAIRSPRNLNTLVQALAETDPQTTSVVVMTAKVSPPGSGPVAAEPRFDQYDQELMTAVVQHAERAGKEVHPLIVPTNNPLYAVMKTARELQAHELILGASNKYTADEQMDKVALYWIGLHDGQTAPLTVRIIGGHRDLYLDLAGGNRIPKISERKARSVAELRAAGVGVHRVMVLHDGTPACSDLFTALLTGLDPGVGLAIVPVIPEGREPLNGHSLVKHDKERAEQLHRDLRILEVQGDEAAEIVRLARENEYDLIVVPLSQDTSTAMTALDARTRHILQHAPCRVFLAAPLTIPQEVVDSSP
jgi:nucleotide-binding universal stress UspA family protein